jgi:hypothetical protein
MLDSTESGEITENRMAGFKYLDQTQHKEAKASTGRLCVRDEPKDSAQERSPATLNLKKAPPPCAYHFSLRSNVHAYNCKPFMPGASVPVPGLLIHP